MPQTVQQFLWRAAGACNHLGVINRLQQEICQLLLVFSAQPVPQRFEEWLSGL